MVERFFAWINRNRRLAKDFEASIASAEAFLYAASVMLPAATQRSLRLRFETDSEKLWVVRLPRKPILSQS